MRLYSKFFLSTILFILSLTSVVALAADEKDAAGKPKCGETDHVCVCKKALNPGKTLNVLSQQTPAPAPRLLTPTQVDGPFYPGYAAFAGTSNDLTQGLQAGGTPIVLLGRVMNQAGDAIPNAEVQIWQTDGLAGKYRHINDPDHAQVDPKFNSWGKTETGSNGDYFFRTVRPIAYPAGDPSDPSWMRPDHVHVAVFIDGKFQLVTQLYFEGDVYLGQDKILQRLDAEHQQTLIVKLELQERTWTDTEGKKEVLTGTFDIVLP